MKTNYTIIAFRPTCADYCRGCYMGGSSEDLQIEHFDSFSAAAEFYAKMDMFKETDPSAVKDPREWASYELTVLINGEREDYLDQDAEDFDAYQIEFTNFHIRVSSERSLIKAVLDKKKTEAEAAAERQRLADIEDLETGEKELLALLLKKHGNPNIGDPE